MRGSDQAVYTLEVYTLLYSYISVEKKNCVTIDYCKSRGVGCSLLLSRT